MAQEEKRYPHILTVSEDPEHVSTYGRRRDSDGRALYSALVTLALGVLGSTVLPVPYAFSKTGICVGALTMALVAFVNDRTCCMLIRCAAATGLDTYEELAMWAGGIKAKVFTQVSLILLLFGTLCGGLAFLSDVARIMVQKGLPSAPRLLRDDGRPVMMATVACILLPLCLQRHIRQFEKAATVGVVVVIALISLIVSEAVWRGFPAVASGELPLVALKLDSHLPEAFAVFGFAFYMQPMLMPLLREMPPGPAGTRLTEKAVHITLYVVALGTYGTVGIFGAAIFGDATESNIMVNDLMDAPGPTLALYAALLGYLCCGMVTTHYALRASLDIMLVGPHAPYEWHRQALETLGILSSAMTVALLFPTQAEKIFALTGCTAVCMVCYVIPVCIHLTVLARSKELRTAADVSDTRCVGTTSSTACPSATPAVCQAAAAAGACASVGNGKNLREPLLAAGAEEQQEEGDCGCAPALSSSVAAGLVNGNEHGHCRSFKGQGCCALAQPLSRGADALPPPAGCHSTFPLRPGGCRFTVMQLALPALVVVVGVGFSTAGLWVAVRDFSRWWTAGA